MLSNAARQKLQQKQPMLGVLSPTTDPILCEYLGFAGFDLYMIDGEHGAITLSEVSQLVRACDVVGIPCLARIRSIDEKLILQYLDAGVCGVMMPGVKTADDVRRLVQAIKYPPMGERGLGPVRAADYLMGKMNQGEYVAYANETTLVLPQIEDLECVKNLDEILQVAGVDGFIIGPRDLAMSMGYYDGPNHPEVKAMMADIMARVLAAGKHVGTVAATAEQAKDLMAQGATIVLNSVQGLLAASAKNFLAAR